MKKNKFILFTAGQGPQECSLAVYGVQQRFKLYLNSNKIAFRILNQNKGSIKNSMKTIVIELEASDESIIKPWLGSIQWACKSPIRKSHKRKNWFIKGEEVHFNEDLEINVTDVSVQTFRASGPGGQHRNKVETAIRLIHQSSGIIVTASDSKSQFQNKKKAWQKLTDKLKMRNEQLLEDNNTDQWSTQLIIERGSPIKIFKGMNFKE